MNRPGSLFHCNICWCFSELAEDGRVVSHGISWGVGPVCLAGKCGNIDHLGGVEQSLGECGGQ